MRTNLSTKTWINQGVFPSYDNISDEYFKLLWSMHPEEHGKVKIYGKVMDVPRWQKSYINSYTFSGMNHTSDPLPDEFKPYLDWANSLDDYQGKFNQVLINWYQDGMHYISSHSDDEKQLVDSSPIMTISLGADRKFRIRDKSTKKIVKDIIMANGTYIVMCGDCQKEYKHEIVKVSGKKGLLIKPRISITFRQFK